MLYDVENRRPTEADHMLGDLVRRADRLGIEVPILRRPSFDAVWRSPAQDQTLSGGLYATNGGFRRNLAVRARSCERPDSTLLGHSAFALGMALPAPKPTFAPVRGSIGASG
jgi:hypothetical protein